MAVDPDRRYRFADYWRHLIRMSCKSCDMTKTASPKRRIFGVGNCRCKTAVPPFIWTHDLRSENQHLLQPIRISFFGRVKQRKPILVLWNDATIVAAYIRRDYLRTNRFFPTNKTYAYGRTIPMLDDIATSMESAELTIWTARLDEPAVRLALLADLAGYFAEFGIGRLVLAYLEFPVQ